PGPPGAPPPHTTTRFAYRTRSARKVGANRHAIPTSDAVRRMTVRRHVTSRLPGEPRSFGEPNGKAASAPCKHSEPDDTPVVNEPPDHFLIPASFSPQSHPVSIGELVQYAAGSSAGGWDHRIWTAGIVYWHGLGLLERRTGADRGLGCWFGVRGVEPVRRRPSGNRVSAFDCNHSGPSRSRPATGRPKARSTPSARSHPSTCLTWKPSTPNEPSYTSGEGNCRSWRSTRCNCRGRRANR